MDYELGEEGSNVSDLLVLYGATGQTGRHILPMAVGEGLSVRCYVRSPDKIPTEHRDNANVEIVQGDFEDAQGVAAALGGANAVICVGGGPSTFKPGLMFAVTKAIVEGMRTHGVKRLVYQSGAFSPAPGTQNPPLVRWFLRPMLGPVFGISGMFKENDALMAYVAAEAKDLDWTFTRPGQIEEGPSRGQLKASETMSAKCQFVDLARLNLDLAMSRNHVHSFPYVNYD